MNEFKSADDILDYAIQREQEAVDFCSDLAAGMEDENVRATFLGLAQEEAKHKLRFEVEYDDMLQNEK